MTATAASWTAPRDAGGSAWQIEAVHLKAALGTAMAMAQDANAYLSDTEPWKTAKTDRERTATSLYTVLCVINALKVALYRSCRSPARPSTSISGWTARSGGRVGGAPAGAGHTPATAGASVQED